MNVREFERFLTGPIGGFSAPDLDLRTRRLREHRMLPIGGRGLNAPVIDAGHVATILIAIAGSEKAVHAHQAVLTYAPMIPKNEDRSKLHFDFKGCKTFAAMLEDICDKQVLADRVEKIEICRSWPEARIFWKDGDGNSKTQLYAPSDQPESGYGAGAYVSITFKASFVSMLPLKIHGAGGENEKDLKE